MFCRAICRHRHSANGKTVLLRKAHTLCQQHWYWSVALSSAHMLRTRARDVTNREGWAVCWAWNEIETDVSKREWLCGSSSFRFENEVLVSTNELVLLFRLLLCFFVSNSIVHGLLTYECSEWKWTSGANKLIEMRWHYAHSQCVAMLFALATATLCFRTKKPADMVHSRIRSRNNGVL